jgi:hypothetical protein
MRSWRPNQRRQRAGGCAVVATGGGRGEGAVDDTAAATGDADASGDAETAPAGARRERL